MDMFCYQCGKQLQHDAMFCDACGASAARKTVINRYQRRILVSIAAIIAGMMLYPPYYYLRDPDTHTAGRHGYDWLLGSGYGRVEVDLLLTQFLVNIDKKIGCNCPDEQVNARVTDNCIINVGAV